MGAITKKPAASWVISPLSARAERSWVGTMVASVRRLRTQQARSWVASRFAEILPVESPMSRVRDKLHVRDQQNDEVQSLCNVSCAYLGSELGERGGFE
jgi:hypothetical protein